MKENAFENVVCKKAAILSQPQFVNLSFTFNTMAADDLAMQRARDQAINSHCMDRVYQEYSVFNNSRVNSFIAKPRWQIAIWKVFLMHSQILYMRQNDSHFADCTFKCIFSNENCYILIQIWLKFFPEGPVDNTLVVIRGVTIRLATIRYISRYTTHDMVHDTIQNQLIYYQWKILKHCGMCHQYCYIKANLK